LKFILFSISIWFLGCLNINQELNQIKSKTQPNLKIRNFQFNYSVEIDPTDNKKLEMWIPIPQSNEVQTISNLKINAEGLNYTIEKEKKHNNKYIYINHINGTTESKTLELKFDVSRVEHSNVNYNNVNPNDYLNAYNTVPIGGVFDEIIKENNLSNNNVRNTYNYVLQGMHYGKPKSTDNQYYKEPWLAENEKYGMKKVDRDQVVNFYKKAKKENGNYTFGNGNSKYACDIGVGNCTDYHSYFMSLNRTMEIPSRFHMGFSIPTSESGKIGGYHCWADYYIEDEGWYPVDISEADKNPKKIDYFFGTIDYNRFEMMVGRDFVLNGLETKSTNLFIYPIMEVNDINSLKFNKSFFYKNL